MTIPNQRMLNKLRNLIADATGVRYIEQVDLPAKNAVVLSVPILVQVQDYTCGFVAIAAVIKALHPGANLDGLFDDVSASPQSGVSTTRLIHILRNRKVSVSVRRSLTMTGIRGAIDYGRSECRVAACRSESKGLQNTKMGLE